MGRLIDLTGKTFGRLKVIKRKEKDVYVNGEILWECECSCANRTIIYAVGSALRQGHKSSCGCIWKPDMQELLYKTQVRLVKYSKLNGQCVEWTGFKDSRGYGSICMTINGKEYHWQAHRASWLVYRGEIPLGMYVLHQCDNPSCIRIEHLFLGTHQDNMADKMRKGRHIAHKGEECVKSKLTEQQVKEILDAKGKDKTSHELAKEYGVAASTIRSIWQRKNWKHVEK